MPRVRSLLTMKELAERTKLSYSTVRRYLAEPRFRRFRRRLPGGRRYYYLRSTEGALMVRYVEGQLARAAGSAISQQVLSTRPW